MPVTAGPGSCSHTELLAVPDQTPLLPAQACATCTWTLRATTLLSIASTSAR
jgi:hypothetical protein